MGPSWVAGAIAAGPVTMASLITAGARFDYALLWVVVLAAGLAGRGYRLLELAAKLLVTAVVATFVASLFVVPVDPGRAVAGLVPSLPAGGALVAAGILGGAVHVTLVTMHSYTMRAREWTADDYGLATFDVAASMLGAFGVYSVAIFLVTASVLTKPDLSTVGAVGTPFAIAVVLYLLTVDAVPEDNSTLANLGGLGLLAITGTLAANFVRGQVTGGLGPLSGAVLTFAVALGVATLLVGGKYVREEALA